jgi:hypothetical protein
MGMEEARSELEVGGRAGDPPAFLPRLPSPARYAAAALPRLPRPLRPRPRPCLRLTLPCPLLPALR